MRLREGSTPDFLRAAGLRAMGRDDFGLETVELARSLVGAYLLYRGRLLRITETEAYRGADDPASHAFRGRTQRNMPMFGPPGHLYVYFTYGMHTCVNVVGATEGEPSGVLLRAGELLVLNPASGDIESDPANRVPRTSAVGPGRLGRAVGASVADSGMDLCLPGAQALLFQKEVARQDLLVSVSPRVGVSGAADIEWRFFDAGSRFVSRHPRGLPNHTFG